MSKLALNFICKDESHVIERMLNSSKSITDLIVVNDTGSTDGTQELIRKFGEDNNIPTYVFERKFDNFENSRNYAMDKLKEVVTQLNWNPSDIHGYWFDCDEQLIIDENFNKNQLTKDFYMINTFIDQMKYTRNTFFRISKPFRWYGPIHEYIVCDDKSATSGLLTGISVDVKMDGASWLGDVSAKYKSHALVLENYIDKDRSDPRWIFYTAQSYSDAATINDILESQERLRRALKYYKERVSRSDGYFEEISFSQYRIASVMAQLEEPWSETLQEFMKAYSMDPLRGESIKAIIDYYLLVGDWNLAYLYSKFAVSAFHNKNPYPKRLLFLDQSLYEWRFLEIHSAACYYTGRIEESKSSFSEIIKIRNQSPNLFNESDNAKIEVNSKFF